MVKMTVLFYVINKTLNVILNILFKMVIKDNIITVLIHLIIKAYN